MYSSEQYVLTLELINVIVIIALLKLRLKRILNGNGGLYIEFYV